MAKVQTRRAVSLNGLLYQRFKERCHAAGISPTSVVDLLVRRWMGDPAEPVQQVDAMPDEVFEEVKAEGRPPPSPEHVAKRKAAAEAAAAKKKAEKAAALEKARQEREARAIANPCRRENCHIIILHEAH